MDRSNILRTGSRRRFLELLAGIGVSSSALQFMSRDALAEVTDNPKKEVPILHALRQSRDSNGELSDEREAVYRTVDIDRWAKIEAAYNAASRIEDRISELLPTNNIQTSVTTTIDGHHEKKVVQVDYVSAKRIPGINDEGIETAGADAQFEKLRENAPSKITGGFDSTATSYEQVFDVQFNKVTKVLDPANDQSKSGRHYDYKYRPVPGGACFEDTNGAYCTLGVTVTEDNSNEKSVITAGHCLEGSEDSTLYQPDENDGEIGEPDDSRVVDEYGFDAGVLDTNGVEHSSDLASDRGKNEYQHYNAVGVLMEDTLKSYEDNGVTLEKQGANTGTVEGPVTHVGNNTDYLQIHADRDGGDSGGPYFKYAGFEDILIAGIHRGEGITEDHSEGTRMHAIEDRFDVSVYYDNS